MSTTQKGELNQEHPPIAPQSPISSPPLEQSADFDQMKKAYKAKIKQRYNERLQKREEDLNSKHDARLKREVEIRRQSDQIWQDKFDDLKKTMEKMEDGNALTVDKIAHLDRDQIDGLILRHSELAQSHLEAIKKLSEARNDFDQCSICSDGPVEMAIIPCGHRRFCEPCTKKSSLDICPFCRNPISSFIKTR
eukprot:TRINITY_DN2771_c0_g1_i3.p1 TRINITY_DN2771_c0_g1~~TRINITY_DN2771_c0_g1_i3.p1  ORF type:complete len:193 (-),score=40.37 TRINITY_DN2771_c0_g1_i3:30-608(-)